jgi:transcriptional regulator with XRE-family HTH domain
VKNLTDETLFARCIAAHLVFHRLNKGLSKLAVAEKAGLDQRTITFIEKGVNIPSVVTLFLICRAIGVDVAKIVAASARGQVPESSHPFP